MSDDYLYLVFRGRKRATLPSDFLVASKSWITHFAALFRLDGATHRRIKIIWQVLFPIDLCFNVGFVEMNFTNIFAKLAVEFVQLMSLSCALFSDTAMKGKSRFSVQLSRLDYADYSHID